MHAVNKTAKTATEVSDADLIRESVSDPKVFGSLFDRHVDVIHGYISRRVGAPLAEELTAETFARAFARRESFVALHDGASPWLFGIATNLVHNARRAERRQLLAYGKAAAVSGDQPNEFDQAEARVDALRAAPRLVAALLVLDPGDRDALLLFAWQDLSYKEVGVALGIPTGTVASRINRSRRRLRASLGTDAVPDAEGTV
ncbi:MAG: RNA polymerase sigma factor [Actinomycetota bacterium]